MVIWFCLCWLGLIGHLSSVQRDVFVIVGCFGVLSRGSFVTGEMFVLDGLHCVYFVALPIIHNEKVRRNYTSSTSDDESLSKFQNIHSCTRLGLAITMLRRSS